MHWLIERHDELERKLAKQDELLRLMEKGIAHMSAALDRLTQEVADTKSAAASIVTLVTQLQAQIAAGTGTDDSDALNKLSDDLEAAKQAILAALAGPSTQPLTEANDGVAAVGQNS